MRAAPGTGEDRYRRSRYGHPEESGGRPRGFGEGPECYEGVEGENTSRLFEQKHRALAGLYEELGEYQKTKCVFQLQFDDHARPERETARACAEVRECGVAQVCAVPQSAPVATDRTADAAAERAARGPGDGAGRCWRWRE